MIFNVYNSAIPSSTHDPHNMVAASEHTKSRGRLRAVPVYRKRSYAARPVFRGSPVPSGRHSSLELRPGTSTRRHPSSDLVNPLLGGNVTCESGEPQLRGNDQRILCRERDPNLGAPRDRVHRLVFAELHDTMAAAILREKRLKKWRRVEARIDRAPQSAIARPLR